MLLASFSDRLKSQRSEEYQESWKKYWKKYWKKGSKMDSKVIGLDIRTSETETCPSSDGTIVELHYLPL